MCKHVQILYEIVSKAAEIATGTIIGGLFFWRKFKRQKRLENANGNSWRVLELLDATEDAIGSLFWANKERMSDDKQNQIQTNVISTLKKLRTGLLVLKESTSEIARRIDWLDKLLKDHQILIRAVREGTRKPHSTSVDLLKALDESPFLQEGPEFVKLEELRGIITAIAGLYHKDL